MPISNPTATPYNFTAAYQPTPVFGTALPAANVFYVGTGYHSDPGIGWHDTSAERFRRAVSTASRYRSTRWSGDWRLLRPILLSNNGLASGATAQTTVPIIVYVGPRSGEDTPSGNGLGLMLPTNVPPVGGGYAGRRAWHSGLLPADRQCSVWGRPCRLQPDREPDGGSGHRPE